MNASATNLAKVHIPFPFGVVTQAMIPFRTTLALCFGCLPFTDQAQVLTALDVLPLLGDTFRYYGVEDDELFDPGEAGSGVVWDHEDLVVELGSYTQIRPIEPSTAPGISTYPASDLVLERTISMTADLERTYFDLDTTGLRELGSTGDPLSYVFDVPERVQPIPMVFDSVYTGSYCHNSSGFGPSYHTCGETSHVLDGIGTLIMPYGTFNGVRRTTYYRYHVNDDSPTDTSHVTYHRWWIPGLRRPVLELSRFTGSNGVVLSNARTLTPSSVLGVPELGARMISVSPNPFVDRVEVVLAEPIRKEGTVRVLAADGRGLYDGRITTGTSRILVDLGNLPCGMLLMELELDSGRRTYKLIHQQQ
ncbi:MAG: hypothetical protein GFGODING_02343 [Flavobacteriales bacterium]|nr:hypothetical protein [Flavobacteriales bacterium]